jgi:hypothetical protein
MEEKLFAWAVISTFVNIFLALWLNDERKDRNWWKNGYNEWMAEANSLRAKMKSIRETIKE